MTRFTLLAAAMVLGIPSVGRAVQIDFETAGDLANNFRVLAGGSMTQSSNGAANDFISNAANATRSFVYDTTPASAAVQDTFTVGTGSRLNVSADVLFNAAGSSYGVYLVNPLNEAQGYLALFNVNVGGANDQFRFASNAVPNASGAGTLVNGSFANNADVGVTINAFATITVDYLINALNEPVLSLTAGNTTSTITFTGVSAFSNVEVGFRSFPLGTSGVNQIDNITINLITIPEPATLSLIGLCAAGLMGGRRRRVAA